MDENVTSPKFTFKPRWKEELVCSSSNGVLVVEMTMGTPGVYCPTEEKWKKEAPSWAKNCWHQFRDQLEKWCKESEIPLYFEDSAWVVND